MNDNSSTDRENRRLRARVENLQEQLENLAADNRDLHRQMTDIIDHLSAADTGETGSAGRRLQLPPPSPSESIVQRGLRKVLRTAAGAVRMVRRATDPGADMVRVLRFVCEQSPAGALPEIGRDIVLDLPDHVDPLLAGTLDLPWLFAIEAVDAAWIRVSGVEHEVLAARHDLHDHLHSKGQAGLAGAAKDLQRPVIAKVLPSPSLRPGNESILHPVHLNDGSTIWRNTSYLVGLPPGVRRAELRLNTTTPLTFPSQPTDLFVLLSEAPVEGLEHRLTSGIEAVNASSRTILSLAPWTESGHRRLRALTSEERPVYDFGATLHPSGWEVAFRSLVECTRPTTMWAIGHGHHLGSFVDLAKEMMPTLRVVGEPLDCKGPPVHADATIVRTRSHQNTLEGTPGIGALHLVQTAVGRRAASPTPEIRRILGVPADATLVVVAGDLTAPGRAEDAAVVAHRLADRDDVWFRVVGRGPLGPAVADLGRLFGLKRFAVNDTDCSLDEIVAAADVICCPGRNEVLPPSAAMAIATGIPVVAPASGETAEIAESGVAGVHLGGAAGDTEKLADALIRAIDSNVSPSQMPDDEVKIRAANALRTYREALTGRET